jgi:histidyl-tRNA synthetase
MQKPKGTYDVFGSYGKKVIYIEQIIKTLMEKYNYDYFRTPIFEASELYHRGVGDTTDIVSKETYNFYDRGNRNMTLRPEGTAGIVRSLIENKLYADAAMPVKSWYYGPMFRYEQPQSGRFREFYQFGVEVFGSNDSLVDAEVISIPVLLYQLLGLKNIKVKINSLGNTNTRNLYRDALKKYFKASVGTLCEDCQKRYETNPLRILDCKIDNNKEVFKNAPVILDYLNKEELESFNKLQEYLKIMNIDFEVKPNLVRGLDYYTGIVFEVEADIKGFGSQNVLCGGGRYDNLVETLDGPSIPASGFAMGIERLISALDLEEIKLDITDGIDAYVAYMSDNEKNKAISLVNELRLNGFKVDMDYLNRSIKSNFKQSDKLNAKFIIIIGEEELKTGELTIKDNNTREEYKINEEYIINFLDEKIEQE